MDPIVAATPVLTPMSPKALPVRAVLWLLRQAMAAMHRAEAARKVAEPTSSWPVSVPTAYRPRRAAPAAGQAP